MIDFQGTIATNADLKAKFSSNFPNVPDQSLESSLSFTEINHGGFRLSEIKARTVIVIYKRKTPGVQNKLNKETSPTLIGEGTIFRNP